MLITYRPGLGALAQHGKYYYPVWLIRLDHDSDPKRWHVKWWRHNHYHNLSPTESWIPEHDVIDSLWRDQKNRRQIRVSYLKLFVVIKITQV
jgi:hypothetical protein